MTDFYLIESVISVIPEFMYRYTPICTTIGWNCDPYPPEWAEKGCGNSNPDVIVNGHKGREALVIDAQPGTEILLDACGSHDRDGDRLNFNWWRQAEADSYDGEIAIIQPGECEIKLTVPADAAGKDIHIICEVHDDGPFSLVAYKRIILEVK